MAHISIKKVRKSYGKTEVVHGVDLEVPNGAFVAILGPSGCGKSTLLRMIAGLEAITSGEISIDGRVVNKLEPRERGCAMVFQNYALYPHMTVGENIGYALKVASMPKAERSAKVEAAAATVGLAEFLNRKPGELSGGQRQRVAMARAIVREPKAFLFDEPLSNLDAKLRVAMRLEIRRLHNRLKATSIFVTHDQVEALTLADTVVVMNKGNIEQIGTPTEVYRRPATRFVAGFIGSPPMNLWQGTTHGDGVVELAGGGRLKFEPAAFPARVGQTVEVGVRPEELSLAQDGEASTVTFTPEFTEDLGATKLVHGRAGDIEAALSVPAAVATMLNGHGVTLTAPPAAVHLFDPASGRTLWAG